MHMLTCLMAVICNGCDTFRPFLYVNRNAMMVQSFNSINMIVEVIHKARCKVPEKNIKV